MNPYGIGAGTGMSQLEMQQQLQLMALYNPQGLGMMGSAAGMNSFLGLGMPGLGNLTGMAGMGLNMGMGIPNLSVISSAAQFHQPAEKNQIKLFVGGLAFSTTEQDLMNYFQTFGKVENTIVMRDRTTGRGRGFGFVLVSFKDEEEAIHQKG